MKRSTTSLLAGLNVLLVCLLAWLWIDPQGGLRGIHWQPPAAIKPDLGGGLSAAALGREDADVARFMAILDRPVFSPTRRPPPPPKAVGAAQVDPLATIHLYGLFTGSEGGGVIVRVEGKTRRVKVSEAIGEWNLKEVRAGEVVFSRGAETRVVPLVQAKQAAGPAVPQPATGWPAWRMPVPMAPAPSAVPVPGAAVGVPGTPGAAASTSAPGAATSKPSANPFVIGGSR
jgi:hypothetical protein